LKYQALSIIILAAALMAAPAIAQEKHFLSVDPMIGSEGLGRVFIGPSCPFGMVKPSPDCGTGPNSGWLPAPVPVTGFSQLHVSGTGGGPKYGNIQVMPFTGALTDPEQSSLRENETVKLGYYGVILKKSGVKTEITTADKVSFYQFTYPAAQNK
jgi:putative alpha-1,2-mannosidase